jgi:SAM-dependent methyltransferase
MATRPHHAVDDREVAHDTDRGILPGQGERARRPVVVGAPSWRFSEQTLSLELATVQTLVNYHQWIFDEIQPFLGQRVAEIGGGIGTFSELLLRHHVTASPRRSLRVFEPARPLYTALKERCHSCFTEVLRGGRLTVINGSFQSAPARFDTVVMVNVLEHVDQDQELVDQIHAGLEPGGTLIVFVPALPRLYSELDRRAGHVRRYEKTQLESLCRSCGFEIAKSIYLDMAGVVPWYVINVLGRARSLNAALARVYDRFVVPVTRWIERCCVAPVGKNVLVVARKLAQSHHLAGRGGKA